MPRVSQDHLDARRRQILDGSRVCFARYGYEGATVRRLEEATGLSRGAIFHHFRRLRTDPEFRARWAERSEQLTTATRLRLLRQREAGILRDDVDVDVLTAFLELVLEGLVSHLAMGLPAAGLGPVLDLVEETVRRHRPGTT
jgi:AcrR family transcriptional regulator